MKLSKGPMYSGIKFKTIPSTSDDISRTVLAISISIKYGVYATKSIAGMILTQTF
jgi:hypothetical protein